MTRVLFRRRLGPNKICVGTVCAVESSHNLFQRVQVQALQRSDKFGNFKKAWVYSLDEGWSKLCKLESLYELPDQLARRTPQAVQVHLCRLQPRDCDSAWSRAVNSQVIEWLTHLNNNEKNGHFLYGKIVLSVGGHLWLDPVECRQWLPNMGAPSILYSLRSRFLDRALALDNPKHLANLYKLCQEANIKLPDYTKKRTVTCHGPVRQEDETLKPNWAFLDPNELDVVNVMSVDTPSSFFIQRLKFQDLLDSLLNDICDYQAKQKFSAWQSAPHERGSFVIAKFPCNQMWYRAMLEGMESDGNFLVLFVDFGDRAVVTPKEMLPLPDELLSKLPFQAIECSLKDVCPMNGQTWPTSSSDKLSAITHSTEVLDEALTLALKVTAKTRSRVTGGNRYVVKLYDLNAETEISELLVASHEAKLEPGAQPEERSPDHWKEMRQQLGSLLPSQYSEADQVVLDSDDEDKNEEAETAKLPFYKGETYEVINKETVENATAQHAKETTTDSALSLDEDFLSEGSEGFSDEGLTNAFLEGFKHIMPKEVQELLQTESDSSWEVVDDTTRQSPLTTTAEGQADTGKAAPETSMAADHTPCPLIMTAYEPKAVWRQDEHWITVKIMLPAVEKYDLVIDPSFFDFVAESEGRTYFVSKSLFGYVNPDLSKHTNKGQHVEIKLRKLATFAWPRLERPVLHGQQKATQDLDATLGREEDEEENRDWSTPEWKARHQLGKKAFKKQDYETTFPEEWYESDSSGDGEFETNHISLETFDPYDPLRN